MITKNYIKMCEQAEEIQKLCQYKKGDYVITWEGLTILEENFKDNYKKDEWITKRKLIFSKSIWLPTQEQLFEMAFKADTKHRVQLHYGINECGDGMYQLEVTKIDPQDPNYEEEYISDSIQACLLQHIYFIKYNKIWTGEKWVKAE